MSALRSLLTLMTAEGDQAPAADFEREIEEARAQLEEALDALRRARGAWSQPGTLDIEHVRRALDAAERQLDEARVRLQRALGRGRDS